MLRNTLTVTAFLAFVLTGAPTWAAPRQSRQSSAPSSAPIGARVARVPAAQPASEIEAQRYQTLEQSSPEAADYSGGHALVITGSVILLVVLIVLLIVLI